jgi:ABC-2 type transport system permease protein
MNAHEIRVIMGKDVREFSRNRFFVFITLLVLIVWVAIFWVLPNSVDETVRLGVTGLDIPVDQPGLSLIPFGSEQDLRTAVEQGMDDIVAGIAFPAGFIEAVASGEQPTVVLLVPAGLPAQERTLMEGLVEEAAFALSGSPPLVDPITEAQILGTDRIGDQVSLQEQMRPMLLVLVLMVETFALSSLVAIEIQQRTVTAILATPATVTDVLAAKGIFGTTLAFTEVVLLGLLIGAFATNAPIILTALLLGAVLVTGFGMIAGSFGKDFLETLFISLAFMIPLMVPAFGALFPGSAATWVRILPTYGLVEAVVGVTIDGDGWSQVAGALAILAAWGAGAFIAGAMILRRRVATL